MSYEENSHTDMEKTLLTLKQDIENGFFQEKEKLPSVFELAKNYQVSYETMKEVIQLAVNEDILTRRAGVGVFINSQPIFSSGIEQLRSVTKMIQHAGKTPGTQYVSADIVNPTKYDYQYLRSAETDKIAKIERVRTADGDPVVYCIDKVNQQLLPMSQLHSKHSIFQLLEEHSEMRISYAVAFIEPISYDEKISPILNCQPDQAMLLLKQIHYTESDEPVLFSENYFRPDVFRFYVVRQRT
ncbi:HTH-type transcriptional repressor NagR [Paraliobacillus ryukyuensis]|uniref:GntR family transcriptional regulator n=1 Tax=Paraliobacillus ryukyuensis TaxID=200904 RepID=A0A366EH07_9BACI|nr:GntR family transcriptional regulator [Paraliobacillus ryukyuensis]RBP01741.1 GntR family transcriptional regulator [Paraliobacillus ryukyuensis]